MYLNIETQISCRKHCIEKDSAIVKNTSISQIRQKSESMGKISLFFSGKVICFSKYAIENIYIGWHDSVGEREYLLPSLMSQF